jgi:hypothetical protein
MGERFMTAVMCDDVRREEGNKLSYMGIYDASLLVARFPIVLPKLCFVLSVYFRGEDVVPSSVVFRLYNDEHMIGEMSIPGEQLALLADGMRNTAPVESTQLRVGAIVELVPFHVERPCRLKVRAIVDGAELKGGAWPVDELKIQ